MNGLFDLSRNYEDVLPSGVPFSVRELLSGDQAELAKKVKRGNKRAFLEMLASCIVTVGDLKTVTYEDVEKFLANDINYAFVKLRNHTFRGEKEFKFKNEFPLEPGDKEKHIESFSITFTEEFFKTVPYLWVREEMEKLQQNFYLDNPDAEEYIPPYEHTFPEMYSNYDEMLEAQKERHFTFPGTQTTIKWQLVDAGADKIRRATFSGKEDYIASLYMRFPTHEMELKAEAAGGEHGRKVVQAIDWEAVPMYYSDKFREEFMRVEGSVDTIITVRSAVKPNKVERINLTNTVAFFAPSLGT